MPTFANPYTPQTPIGQGLQNVAIALFAGKKNAADNAAADQVRLAHSGLYDAQAAKAAAERKLAEQLYDTRTPDAVDLERAAASGLPVYTLRGIDAAYRGEQDLSPYTPDQLSAYRRATLAVNPAYATKNTSPVDIAGALNTLKMGDDRDAVIAGRLDPTRVGQGYFSTSGKAPFSDMGGNGSFDLLTGVNRLNALGNAKVGTERAHAGYYDAASKAQASLARYRDGLQPKSAKPHAPRKITGTDRALIDSALESMLSAIGVKAIDDSTRNAVIEQAEREWQAGADGHMNAVKAALDKIAPQGFETPVQLKSFIPFMDSDSRPVGGIRAPAAEDAKRNAQTQLPEAARAKLKEGVVTTFGNGQKWTLSDGVPVQVR